MPVYEYQCKSCSKVIEAWQKISDTPLTVCTHCSGELTKIISCSSFHLKGAGWYVTDYAGKNAGNGSAKEASSEKPSEKSSEKTSSPAKAE